MPTDAEIDAALEAVVGAARAHRAALRAQADEDAVWRAYVTLNNATVRYDDLISEEYDEVTPWDCEYLDAVDADGVADPDGLADDDHDVSAGGRPALLCVRQRRDYTVPDPARLLALATTVRRSSWESHDEEHARTPVENLGEAVNELVQAGDGTVAALDAYPDDLVPGNGVLLVNAVDRALVLGDPVDGEADAPFRLLPEDTLLYRLDEEIVDEDDGDDDGSAAEGVRHADGLQPASEELRA